MRERYLQFASRAVTRFWPLFLIGWIALAALLHWVAPKWEDVAKDGDFAFLPADSPSLVAQRWLDQGFPEHRTRSQLVVAIARQDRELQPIDLVFCLDLARRIHQIHGYSELDRAASLSNEVRKNEAFTAAREAFDHALSLEDRLFAEIESLDRPIREQVKLDRLAESYAGRAIALDKLGLPDEARNDEETVQLLEPNRENVAKSVFDAIGPMRPMIEVWTWDNPVLGEKLGAEHEHARLIVLQMESEFIATGNETAVRFLDDLVKQSRDQLSFLLSPGLDIGISGSAAIGADMRRAMEASIQQTEWVTIILILVILAIVYRGPLLVAIPLMTIGLSLMVATSLIALVAKPIDDSSAFGLQVFANSKIFIVVLLFGAGTDFCLFFLARCKEELQESNIHRRVGVQRVIGKSWRAVHDALLGSALTTIIGLGLMWFADFEKFKYTGPTIGICLAVTLVACLTFTPSVICGLGAIAFWPALRSRHAKPNASDVAAVDPSIENDNPFRGASNIDGGPWWMAIWRTIADVVVTFPGTTFVLCTSLLAIPAIFGWLEMSHVTYDFANELSPRAPSRRGADLVKQYFPNADSSPISLVLVRKYRFDSESEASGVCQRMTERLYVEGVEAVRSLSDPLGDFRPGKDMGLFDQEAWRRRILQTLRTSRNYFVSHREALEQRLVRFDVMLKDNPFSSEARATLQRIATSIKSEVNDPKSDWFEAEFAYTGTTAGIADLERITQADTKRIETCVTIGVWMVLLFVLRRFWLSTYLIFTVLFSYLATLGMTHWIFAWLYGAQFDGLDWKVPLFLFVILVAVGQDYNVYLVTRVLEEQQRHGKIEGLRRALIQTGGIITSCGVVMAGTFFSMTSAALGQWFSEIGVFPPLPLEQQGLVLRGMVELGVALTLGVALDTMVVRSVLVPSWMALSARRVLKS